ncbi:MAG: MgtC/SapB family protein, partial [Flavobacteriales bacterium]
TQVDLMIVYVLGGMVQAGFGGLAVLAGVVVTALLALKFQLHTAIGKIEQKDIFAILQFVVLSVLVLPLLPDQAYVPYDVLEPRAIWRIVVIILGIDFFGYLLAKFIGQEKGALVTGVLGGFASSTAVTWSFARRSRRTKGGVGAYAGGIVLASSIMFPRILIWLLIWNKTLFSELVLPILLLAGLGVTLGIYIVRSEQSEEKMDHEPHNPLNLISALTFGLIYSGVLLLVAYSNDQFGDKGVFLASGLSGLTDVNAITISMSKLGGDRLPLFVAHLAIVIGAVANSILKYAICLISGSPELRKKVSVGFLPVVAVACLYLLVKGVLMG